MKPSRNHLLTLTYLLIFIGGAITMDALGALTQSQIVDQTSSALVVISRTDSNGNKTYGTGFIIDSQASVLTNYHVVRNAATLCIMHIDYKQPYQDDNIVVVDVNAIRDIALLRIRDFKGYVHAGGESAAPGAPIKLKSGIEEKDIIKMGKDVLTLSNPAELRRIVTKGVISGIEEAAWIFHKRKALLADAGYKVILFDADVAAGGSGGVILETATGEAVGIVTGAVGDDAFSGFGVPIQYVNQFILQIGDTSGSQAGAFPWKARELENDPYYNGNLYAKKLDMDDSVLFTVSGYVRDKHGDPISNATVQLFGNKDNTILSQRLARSDQSGRFELTIPQVSGLVWEGSVDHKYYEKQSLGSYENIAEWSYEHVLPLRKDLVQEERAYLEVNPKTVELEFGSKKVMLRAYALKGVRRDSSKLLNWKMLVSVGKEWLKVKPTSGIADSFSGNEITLEYTSDLTSEDADTAEAKVYIQPAGNTQDQWGMVLMRVFANKRSDVDPIVVSGYVESQYGGVPETERILVTPMVGDKPIGQSYYVDEFGRFEFPIERQYQNTKIHLKVEGIVFHVPDDTSSFMNVDANNKWHTKITMKPRN